MRAAFPDWPKLLGCVVGLEAFGLLLWQAEYVVRGYMFAEQGVAFAFALLLSVFSFGLYYAQNWARWCAIVFAIVVSTGLIILNGMSVANNWARRGEGVPRATLQELRVDDFLAAFSEVGIGLCFLAPWALVVCILCHPNVVATFSPKKNGEPSN